MAKTEKGHRKGVSVLFSILGYWRRINILIWTLIQLWWYWHWSKVRMSTETTPTLDHRA